MIYRITFQNGISCAVKVWVEAGDAWVGYCQECGAKVWQYPNDDGQVVTVYSNGQDYFREVA